MCVLTCLFVLRHKQTIGWLIEGEHGKILFCYRGGAFTMALHLFDVLEIVLILRGSKWKKVFIYLFIYFYYFSLFIFFLFLSCSSYLSTRALKTPFFFMLWDGWMKVYFIPFYRRKQWCEHMVWIRKILGATNVDKLHVDLTIVQRPPFIRAYLLGIYLFSHNYKSIKRPNTTILAVLNEINLLVS